MSTLISKQATQNEAERDRTEQNGKQKGVTEQNRADRTKRNGAARHGTEQNDTGRTEQDRSRTEQKRGIAEWDGIRDEAGWTGRGHGPIY